MLQTFLNKSAAWLAADGPEALTVIGSECCLHRNLADFSFPATCSHDEKAAIEDRVVGLIDNAGLLPGGQYYSFDTLDDTETAFLVESRLVGQDLLDATGPRGVYISDDYSLTVSVNGTDHVTLRSLASGLQLEEAWARLSVLDDDFTNALDFAFDERLGYLTGSIRHVGTGLRAAAFAHLPGLTMAGELDQLERARAKRHIVEPMFAGLKDIQGDIFEISNRATLGPSEEEILYHLRQFVIEAIEKEVNLRTTFQNQAASHMQDRVGRALGVVRGARLLGFAEAVELLSALRLGVDTGFLGDAIGRHAPRTLLHQMNELLVQSQEAHIKMEAAARSLQAGDPLSSVYDDATLSAVRAAMFRARFS